MYLDVEDTSQLAPEASDLHDELHGRLADQDPHALQTGCSIIIPDIVSHLPLPLDLPGRRRRLRYDAVVRDLRPDDHAYGGATERI